MGMTSFKMAQKNADGPRKNLKKDYLENIGYSHINNNTFVIPIDLLIIFVVVISIIIIIITIIFIVTVC